MPASFPYLAYIGSGDVVDGSEPPISGSGLFAPTIFCRFLVTGPEGAMHLLSPEVLKMLDKKPISNYRGFTSPNTISSKKHISHQRAPHESYGHGNTVILHGIAARMHLDRSRGQKLKFPKSVFLPVGVPASMAAGAQSRAKPHHLSP